MSMNGLTVIRTTRSPNILRNRRRRPGNPPDAASVNSVDAPRSQLSQMLRHTSPI